MPFHLSSAWVSIFPQTIFPPFFFRFRLVHQNSYLFLGLPGGLSSSPKHLHSNGMGPKNTLHHHHHHHHQLLSLLSLIYLLSLCSDVVFFCVPLPVVVCPIVFVCFSGKKKKEKKYQKKKKKGSFKSQLLLLLTFLSIFSRVFGGVERCDFLCINWGCLLLVLAFCRFCLPPLSASTSISIIVFCGFVLFFSLYLLLYHTIFILVLLSCIFHVPNHRGSKQPHPCREA